MPSREVCGWPWRGRGRGSSTYTGRVTIEAFHPDGPDISYPAAMRRKQVSANAEAGHRGLAVLQSLFAQ